MDTPHVRTRVGRDGYAGPRAMSRLISCAPGGPACIVIRSERIWRTARGSGFSSTARGRFSAGSAPGHVCSEGDGRQWRRQSRTLFQLGHLGALLTAPRARKSFAIEIHLRGRPAGKVSAQTWPQTDCTFSETSPPRAMRRSEFCIACNIRCR